MASSPLEDLAVCPLNGSAEVGHAVLRQSGLERPAQNFHRKAAGHVAFGVSPHAVGDDEKPEVRITTHEVLVGLPHPTDVGVVPCLKLHASQLCVPELIGGFRPDFKARGGRRLPRMPLSGR